MDMEKTLNLRRRMMNLSPDHSLTVWKGVLGSMIDAMKDDFLVIINSHARDEYDARRQEINDLKEKLLNAFYLRIEDRVIVE